MRRPPTVSYTHLTLPASAEAERQSKLREADAQTTALARAMCEKLLARNLTAQDDARLLDDLLEKAGAGNGN